ncbi:MAG: phosphate acyltransferase PlsX, partial [Verrucomicrobiales bacterium]
TVKRQVDRREAASSRLEIIDASEVVGMSEKAALSVRRKRDSSISRAIDLVKDGTCEAVVTIGHTGASVAAATVELRMLKGVDRPGIASPLPNEYGVCNILDAGANVEAKPQHILQYGFMGHVYARRVLGREEPRIGLMSVGEEDEKGTAFTRECFQLLSDAPINFIGNVEGHDLFESPVDIVLCDGFVGNVILKSCEATAKVLLKWIRTELRSSPLRTVGSLMAKGAFREAKRRTDYQTYGGSPLLGVNGICIIGHGSSSPVAVKNAIRVAAEAIDHEVNPHIEEAISNYTHAHA